MDECQANPSPFYAKTTANARNSLCRAYFTGKFFLMCQMLPPQKMFLYCKDSFSALTPYN